MKHKKYFILFFYLFFILFSCSNHKGLDLTLLTFCDENSFALLKPDFILYLRNSEILDSDNNVIYRIEDNEILDINTNEKCGTINFKTEHADIKIVLNVSIFPSIDKIELSYSKRGKISSIANYSNGEMISLITISEEGLPTGFYKDSENMFINDYHEENNYNHYFGKIRMPLLKIEYKNPSLSNNLWELEEESRYEYKYIEFDSNGNYELDTHFVLNNNIAPWSHMTQYEKESKTDYVNWNDSYFAKVSKYDFTNKDDGFKFLKQFALSEKLIPGNSVILEQFGVGRLYIEGLYCFKVVKGTIDYSSCYKIELTDKPKLSGN